MFFIGIITDKNSENNIKNRMINKIDENEIIFLNKENLENFKNVKFDSIIVNEEVENKYILKKILEKSKYIVWNSDIHCKSENLKNSYSNVITYGYNSKATVTISSATEENYLIFIQENIPMNDKITGIQEVKFEKNENNIAGFRFIISRSAVDFNKKGKTIDIKKGKIAQN